MPDSGQPATPELPAAKPGSTPKWDGKHWQRSGRLTIASLGLNLEKARERGYLHLFPRDLMGSLAGENYPLPSSLDEVYAISLVPLPKGAQGNVARYIRKAAKSYKKRCIQHNLVASEKAVHRMDVNADRVRQAKREAVEQIRAAAESVVALAAETTTKFSELDELHKAGLQKIMAAFVAGEPLNGQVITPEQFTSCARIISGYKARVGGGALDPTAKGEAEGAIFEEVSAATKARLAASMPVEGSKPS